MTRIGSVTVPVGEFYKRGATLNQFVVEDGWQSNAIFSYDRSLVAGGKLWVESKGNEPITHVRYRRRQLA